MLKPLPEVLAVTYVGVPVGELGPVVVHAYRGLSRPPGHVHTIAPVRHIGFPGSSGRLGGLILLNARALGRGAEKEALSEEMHYLTGVVCRSGACRPPLALDILGHVRVRAWLEDLVPVPEDRGAGIDPARLMEQVYTKLRP